MSNEWVSDDIAFVGVRGAVVDLTVGRLRGLLLKGLDGDQAAYRLFLQEVTILLRGYIRRQLMRGGSGNGDAEDIVQEALIAIHEKRHIYEAGLPVTAWAHAIARYKMIDALRSARRRRLDVPLTGEEEVLQDDAQAAMDGMDVRQALNQLPERMRTPIALTKLDGYSIAEAASRTGLSESAVKVNVHRGLKALGRMFGRSDKEDAR